MIHKLESIDTVLNKVVRDLGLGENEIPYQDMIEWSAEALEHIGSYTQFETKFADILIENYEGVLPSGLYKTVKMELGCEITANSGGFYGGSLQQELNNAGVDYESLGAYTRFKIINGQGLSKPSDEYIGIDGISQRLSNNPNLGLNTHSRYDYRVNFNQIVTSFCHGIIRIQYLAFPVDSRGYPLVPDNQSFRDALFWKIAYQIAMRNPMALPNQMMRDIRFCKDEWNKYCMQARASANMPDLAQMERLKNNWLRLHNTLDEDAQNYRDLGSQQRLDLDGRH
jgi:hypothetical protein